MTFERWEAGSNEKLEHGVNRTGNSRSQGQSLEAWGPKGSWGEDRWLLTGCWGARAKGASSHPAISNQFPDLLSGNIGDLTKILFSRSIQSGQETGTRPNTSMTNPGLSHMALIFCTKAFGDGEARVSRSSWRILWGREGQT